MSENLRKMGANIEILKGGKSENIIIRGVKRLKGTTVRSFSDHRTAMSMVVAGLGAKGKTFIDNITCINKSFPGFLHTLNKLILK
jgi:3-phosphoshikimate 1-carboxyvinyltransferase